jgi:hypothetical protein
MQKSVKLWNYTVQKARALRQASDHNLRGSRNINSSEGNMHLLFDVRHLFPFVFELCVLRLVLIFRAPRDVTRQSDLHK